MQDDIDPNTDAKQPTDASKAEPANIIIADTDKADQENFKEAVGEARINAKVTTTDSGQELMDNLKDESIPNPDIIFMENKMPLDDGKDLLTEIKKDDELKDIPTVIYTASHTDEDVEEAFKTGASLFVTKPIFFRNLVLLLRRIFTANWKRILSRPLRKYFFIHEVSLDQEQRRDTATQDRTKDIRTSNTARTRTGHDRSEK